MQARTRNELIALRAAEALAKQLAKARDVDSWQVLLNVALMQAEESAPVSPLNRVRLNVQVEGVPAEDL